MNRRQAKKQIQIARRHECFDVTDRLIRAVLSFRGVGADFRDDPRNWYIADAEIHGIASDHGWRDPGPAAQRRRQREWASLHSRWAPPDDLPF